MKIAALGCAALGFMAPTSSQLAQSEPIDTDSARLVGVSLVEGPSGALTSTPISSKSAETSLQRGSESQKLLSPNGAESDLFGFAASVSGDHALIGAYGDYDQTLGGGSVLVFRFTGDQWMHKQTLVPNEVGPAYFGQSVEIDGSRAVIGAPNDNDNGFVSGSAYVFEFDGQHWTESAKLLASDGSPYDHFGISVALSGNLIVVGALGDDDLGDLSGSAYVFAYDNGMWSESTKLVPSDGQAGDIFGWDVDIYDSRLLVGSKRSAYVYDNAEALWSESSQLAPSSGAAGDLFERSVSLYADRALVVAPHTGLAAFVFEFDGSSWNQTEILVPTDGPPTGTFGRSVELFGDRALIGHPTDDDNGVNSGSAYVFSFENGEWVESAKLLPADGQENDEFGVAVSLSGSFELIGAPYEDTLGSSAGSAYVFEENLVFRSDFED